jgi:hypothetical protein
MGGNITRDNSLMIKAIIRELELDKITLKDTIVVVAGCISIPAFITIVYWLCVLVNK